MAHHHLEGGLRLRVHRSLPQHSGLGSGTQLALAVARAIAELRGISAEVTELARATGRARRSAVGTWTFAGGGLVVEGGRRPAQDDCGPLLARLPFPEPWRCVVVVPEAAPGVSGGDEEAAFERLPIPPERDVERVAHLVLMGLMPAVLDADIGAFGHALTEIQEVTGQWFASAQGGTFAAGASAAAVRLMRELGAAGVGQSSWGPAAYGIVEGQATAVKLAEALRRQSEHPSVVYEGAFPTHGARVWRG
jgi:beta-RFAP synthase